MTPWERKLEQLILDQQRRLRLLIGENYTILSNLVGRTTLRPGPVYTTNVHLSNQIDDRLTLLNGQIVANISEGTYLAWGLSDDMNDAMVQKFFKGTPGVKKFTGDPDKWIKKGDLYYLKDFTASKYLGTNKAALDAFMVRRQNGMNLSDRVWNLTRQVKDQIELTLANGINEGTGAKTLARELKQNLLEPDRLFRRVRNKQGELVLSKPASEYHPGRGVYRSSVKNAQRLARTEINMSYRSADFERRNSLPFVKGIRVFLSGSHRIYDICDVAQGDYPKEFQFTGWHPNCMCQTESILPSEDEMRHFIRTGELDGFTDTLPAGMNRILKLNGEKLDEMANKPYWYRDNLGLINSVKNTDVGILPVAKIAEFIPAQTVAEARTWAQRNGFNYFDTPESFANAMAEKDARALTQSYDLTDPFYAEYSKKKYKEIYNETYNQYKTDFETGNLRMFSDDNRLEIMNSVNRIAHEKGFKLDVYIADRSQIDPFSATAEFIGGPVEKDAAIHFWNQRSLSDKTVKGIDDTFELVVGGSEKTGWEMGKFRRVLSTDIYEDKVAGTYLHEYGHYYDIGLNHSTLSKEIRGLMKTDQSRIMEELSYYAGEEGKATEAVAEAFALYHNPQFDMFDESTKSLIKRILKL